MVSPLRITFDVDCPPHARVRRVDVADRDLVAARSHRDRRSRRDRSGEPAGGQIYETAAGVKHTWGVVTVWEPPRRLAYRWHLGRDRVDATEVEIRFVDERRGPHAHRDRTQRLGASRRGRGHLA